MPRSLDVYWGPSIAGSLQQDDSGALSFAYALDWLANGRPLSASLPLREVAFSARECRPFFAGLLPEQESRKLVAQGFGVSERNDFALLEKIGAECAGAVSLVPAGSPPPDERREYREISLSELAERFSKLPTRPLLAGEEGIRLSLAGAQGKLALVISEGQFLLPLEGSPSTHILKPQSIHFPGLAQNEFFCMSLAQSIGLDVAKVELGMAGTFEYLQVGRYDRGGTDGRNRIHQEDFCQALALPPEMKYQEEGGPSLRRCFELVQNLSDAPALDVLKLFDAVVFNFLIGNCDAHGKNFSFLLGEDGTRLAPLYDLVCTRIYEGISPTMAMKIGGEKHPDRLFAKNWESFIKEIGFSLPAAKKRMLGLVEKVKTSISRLSPDFPGHSSISPLILENCESLSLSMNKSS